MTLLIVMIIVEATNGVERMKEERLDLLVKEIVKGIVKVTMTMTWSTMY